MDEEKARVYGKIHSNKEQSEKLAAAGILPSSSSPELAGFNSTAGSMVVSDGAFRVLSRPITGAFVSARGAHSITVAFTPIVRRVHEATLVAKVRKVDGQTWKIPPSEDGSVLSELQDLTWLFPLNGLPDLGEPDWKHAAVVLGTVGVPVTCRLEAALSGVATGRGHPVGVWLEGDRHESLALTEGSLAADEFTFNLLYPDIGSTVMLSRLIDAKLIGQLQDKVTGLVVLQFDMKFTAERTFTHRAELLIHSTGGGMWKFPLTISADYPPPTGVVSLPNLGGGVESTAQIVITNYDVDDSIPFSARFEPLDPCFSVNPKSGLLGPCGSPSKELALSIHFKPPSYGKNRETKLVINVSLKNNNFLSSCSFIKIFNFNRLERTNVLFIQSKVLVLSMTLPWE